VVLDLGEVGLGWAEVLGTLVLVMVVQQEREEKDF
jgi:hypothetical protein